MKRRGFFGALFALPMVPVVAEAQVIKPPKPDELPEVTLEATFPSTVNAITVSGDYVWVAAGNKLYSVRWP